MAISRSAAELADAPGVYAVARSWKKPNAETAAVLANSGRHLWNSGMFVFPPGRCCGRWSVHAPEVLPPVRQAWRSDAPTRLHPPGGGAVPRLPVDQPGLRGGRADDGSRRGARQYRLVRLGQLERAVGVGEERRRRERGDRGCGAGIRQGLYVRSDGMLTAVVGVKDAIVVVTDDVALVMHRDNAQDVKTIVERLKSSRPA